VTPHYSDWTNRLALPVSCLIASYWLQGAVASLPASYLELLYYLPFILSGVAILLANQFRQSAIATAAILQIATFYLIQQWLQEPLRSPVPTQLFGWLSMLLPLNWLALSFVPEQKIFSRFGATYCAALLVQVGLVTLLVTGGPLAPIWTDGLLRLQGLSWSWMPIPGLILHLLALGVLVYRIHSKGKKSDSALLGGLLLNSAMLIWFGQSQISLQTASISLVLLLITIVLFSHDLAFIDELTQLPGRRALMGDLKLAGNQYTVAMLDVDHFKKFNDTYGHDTGDQVLKLVASRLNQVGGGGKAYRYGGEEFTILFRNKSLDECLPYLDEVREAIARYRLVLRNRKQRQPNHKQGKQLRGQANQQAQRVQITISIGATEKHYGQHPMAALKQADIALYAAKESGRNCVKSK